MPVRVAESYRGVFAALNIDAFEPRQEVERIMRLTHRLTLALVILLVDTAAFAVPLGALLLAYILIARPAWFRDWVERLYRG